MRIGDLIRGLDGLTHEHGRADIEITGLTEDSRTVTPGALFVARVGGTAHGGTFIRDAVERGAAAILTDHETAIPPQFPTIRSHDPANAMALIAERFFGDPSRKLRLVGVTGTNGKTTTAHLTQQILNRCGCPCGLIGTVLIDDGAKKTPAHLTTPGAIEISAAMARMAANHCAAAVMEVSSHALQQQRTDALHFDAAVYTNLSGDHLDYHGTMNAYADVKARLFEQLSADAVAILNNDDPLWERFARGTSAAVVRCSTFDETAEARIQCGRPSIEGAEVTLNGPWGEISGHSRLLGEHNLMNLLQAVAAAHAVGADVRALDGALEELQAPPGRLEPVALGDAKDAPTILVDYAHTDDALSNALRAVRPIVPQGGSLWVVFGCGGDRDTTKRPRMGAVAAKLADRIVITSDNPRRENPDRIIAGILEGVPETARDAIVSEADRAAAIRFAVTNAAPDDVILIAGKGHEDYQLLPDGAGGVRRRDFDDRVEARQALALRQSMRSRHSAVTR